MRLEETHAFTSRQLPQPNTRLDQRWEPLLASPVPIRAASNLPGSDNGRFQLGVAHGVLDYFFGDPFGCAVAFTRGKRYGVIVFLRKLLRLWNVCAK